MSSGEKEDKIFAARAFISELACIQEQYFDKLVDEIGLTDETQKEFLFDYVFNFGADEEFDVYLEERLKVRKNR